MKAFSVMFLVLFVFVTVAATSAGADNWPAGRKDRKDSKALCYIFTPWPFRHVCCEAPMDTDGDGVFDRCLLYTSPSPRDRTRSRMPSSA